MFRKVLDTAAEWAGLTRPVTLSNFRKSCASYLASQNVNQVNIEGHMGWTRRSQVAARYIAIFSGDGERQSIKACGADGEQAEPDLIAPSQLPV